MTLSHFARDTGYKSSSLLLLLLLSSPLFATSLLLNLSCHPLIRTVTLSHLETDESRGEHLTSLAPSLLRQRKDAAASSTLSSRCNL